MMKVGLIVLQEYKNRVTKKSFLFLTLLTPFLFAALIIVPLKLAQLDTDEEMPIAVVDMTGLYADVFANEENSIMFDVIVSPNADSENFRRENSEDYRAFVVIDKDLAEDPTGVKIYSENALSQDVQSSIETLLSQYVEHQKLTSYNIEGIEQMIENAKTQVRAQTFKMDDGGEEEIADTTIASLIGILTTTLIYMFIFISGSQVMQSVVQEKVNRIVEVMICSVKPWELMFGKIIGVALVCLTQIAIWIVLTMIFVGVGADMAGLSLSEMNGNIQQGGVDISEAQSVINSVMSVNWSLIVITFIVYFIGGYLLYASLFAAVGAAVDNESDTSQFMLPVTLLLIFALYAGIYSAKNPDGPLAFWCSIIPLTSPIVMMVRIPFDVPAWEIATSLGLLALSVVVMVWLSAKIYRVGILMYGKKPSWREILKWFKY
ncbi:MAG: ABC transporter permease [bacterium]|nr:ABC transporter permease [Candidatus Minthenecus merdequi]